MAKTKALISSNCEADLRLCFRLCRLLVFPCDGSFLFQFSSKDTAILKHVKFREDEAWGSDSEVSS